ncbi:hypothetical protein A3194_12590 [Candidatus Thiodiazotropha endoloripes]|uniref:hypothetical protein n=1 Tax=Candidatus Thiodiazotropha endoloripes TaxID=1818881 RepID=UPI00083CF241|nr:hypothetical protein [Candidatus Thiodiazotropha endoloripes]ODB85665.1 hypothetical protein A3194_12590 [Candidatus Thiodiazotropha endoloripes]
MSSWQLAGPPQHTLKVMVSLAKTLHTIPDALVFEESERGPDEELRLQFKVIRALLDGMIIKHRTKQMVNGLSG